MALAPIPEINDITSRVIKAAIEVHRCLGPGLFESVYLACLVQELRASGLSLETQRPVPVSYRDVKIDCSFRVDLVVNGK
jgi:GxxExxY protein